MFRFDPALSGNLKVVSPADGEDGGLYAHAPATLPDHADHTRNIGALIMSFVLRFSQGTRVRSQGYEHISLLNFMVSPNCARFIYNTSLLTSIN